MHKIVGKRVLNAAGRAIELTFKAPLAALSRAGQFIILRVDEFGERAPFFQPSAAVSVLRKTSVKRSACEVKRARAWL